jgi:hypothetical protein
MQPYSEVEDAEKAAWGKDHAYNSSIGVIVHRGVVFVYPRDRVERLYKNPWWGPDVTVQPSHPVYPYMHRLRAPVVLRYKSNAVDA